MMDCEKLIGEIYKRTPIWDMTDKRHSNRFIVEKCWKQVEEEMEIEDHILRRKWKYLRDQYSVELGKLRPVQFGDPTSAPVTSKWAYFQALSFLEKTVKPRATKGNSSRNFGEEIEHVDVDPEDSSSQYFFKEEHDSSNEMSTSEGQCAVEEDSNDVVDKAAETNTTRSEQRQSRKRSQTDAYNDVIMRIEKQKLQYLKEKYKKQKEDDEDLLFFKSLLPHVRKIAPSKKLPFRGHIQNIVNRFAYDIGPQSASTSQVQHPPAIFDSVLDT